MPDSAVHAALFAIGLSGFHVAITLLALYRARKALRTAGQEGRGDRRTLWRLAMLRFVAAIVMLSGGILAIGTPLAIAVEWGLAFLPTTGAAIAALLGGAWLVWIPATLALDNLALRWLRPLETKFDRHEGAAT